MTVVRWLSGVGCQLLATRQRQPRQRFRALLGRCRCAVFATDRTCVAERSAVHATFLTRQLGSVFRQRVPCIDLDQLT
jgi:hypothetical protein